MAGNAADPTQPLLLGRDQSRSSLLRDLPRHPQPVLVTGLTETWATLCMDGAGGKCCAPREGCQTAASALGSRYVRRARAAPALGRHGAMGLVEPCCCFKSGVCKFPWLKSVEPSETRNADGESWSRQKAP